jgi:hypothetical protein
MKADRFLRFSVNSDSSKDMLGVGCRFAATSAALMRAQALGSKKQPPVFD